MSPPNKSGAWSWWRAETDPGMIIFVSLDHPLIALALFDPTVSGTC